MVKFIKTYKSNSIGDVTSLRPVIEKLLIIKEYAVNYIEPESDKKEKLKEKENVSVTKSVQLQHGSLGSKSDKLKRRK